MKKFRHGHSHKKDAHGAQISIPNLFWGLGMFAFAVAVLFELVFALGVYSTILAKAYFFITLFLVELLAIGSVQAFKSRIVRNGYYVYAAMVAVAAAAIIAISKMPDPVINYVVSGMPPQSVLLVSSLATFAGVVIILAGAIASYMKTKKAKILSIIIGVILFSIAGTLYIASFPEILYYGELVAVIFLWAGMV
ncbi:MAG: hypothetical protein M1331_01155 [Candidatus Marsarchaeota archaeon]|nr:hypothetical protein [Candidatus Marsarchaeota archaeon]MCL5105991.1 hypothetical protein [Candidatus Marsarchaeota archaeon]